MSSVEGCIDGADNWTKEATVADFLKNLIDNGACYQWLIYVTGHLGGTLPGFIKRVRETNPDYSKWLDDNGYNFTWEKPKGVHRIGNRYSFWGAEYILARVGEKTVALIDLSMGNRYVNPVFAEGEVLSSSEWDVVTDGDPFRLKEIK